MRSIRQYHIFARSISTICVMTFLQAFFLPSTSHALLDGDWEGVTDQGLSIFFSTSGETANDIVTQLRVYCSGFSAVTTTNWGSRSIVNSSFSVSGSTFACNPFEPWNTKPYGFTANFTGETTCQGTYYYSTTQSGTWEATNSSTAPTVTTSPVSSVTSISATSGGDVTSDGGASVTARGVCWSTSSSPTTTDDQTSDGIGTGTFSSSITGLSPDTPYYIRAYATNIYGTGYGLEHEFRTLARCPQCDGDPVVITNSTFDSETQCDCSAATSITIGANVLIKNGATVIFRAPIVKIEPGAKIEEGAIVNVKQQ